MGPAPAGDRRVLMVIGVLLALGLAVASERYAAFRRDQVRLRDERVARLRLKAVDTIDRGLRLRASGALNDARLTLETLLERLHDESSLADLHRRADGELGDVKRRLGAAASAAADQERLARFRTVRDRALLLDGNAAIFPETLVHAEAPATIDRDPRREGSADVDAATAVAAIRATAQEALEVFPPGAAAGALPEALSAEQRAEVEADRYLLLMVLSEAVARALPGEDPREQPRMALGLLDRAAALHAPTPAMHLRRAACFARLGDETAARSERERSARIATVDAFDQLLLGREAVRRNAWDEARTHLKAAVRLRPDSFRARCLLAVAELNSTPPRASEAETELTACLLQQPSYAWLYLLRGSASGQMAVALAATARAEAEARFGEAEADFRKAQDLGLENGLDYVLLMNRGVMRFQRGQLVAAAADFETAIARDPGRYHAYASLAQVHRRLGRYDDAVARLDEAIAREPGLAALYRARALVQLDRDRGRGRDRDRGGFPPAKAEPVLRNLETSARLEGPGSRAAADDHARRGRLLLEVGPPDDALKAADAALATAPDAAAGADGPDRRSAGAGALQRGDRPVRRGPRFRARIRPAATPARTGTGRAQRLRRGRSRITPWRWRCNPTTRPISTAIAAGRTCSPARPSWRTRTSRPCSGSTRPIPMAAPAGPRRGFAWAGSARHWPMPRSRFARSVPRPGSTTSPLRPTRRRRSAPSPRWRTGRVATRDSLAYEARAADLLAEALARTPADRRTPFWHDVVARDVLLRPLLRNPSIVRRLQPGDAAKALSQRAGVEPRRD